MEASFAPYIGRRQDSVDALDPRRSAALLSALGRPKRLEAGDALPPLFHWLYFWDVPPPARTGADGHPKLGDFMPPIEAARRMWAGGRLTFHQPLRLGEPARRITTILDIAQKTGRTGALTFVTLEHQLHGADGLAVTEQQDIVYRQAVGAAAAPPPPAPAAQPRQAEWSRAVDADPVLLFRYSALTMNSHRIHYDQPYATQAEGYAGLVVHGPLMATLMLTEAVEAAGVAPAAFSFRGRSPAFSGVLRVGGRRDGATAETFVEQGGQVAMDGAVQFEAGR